MKRLLYMMVIMSILAGCSSEDSLGKAMELRQKVTENCFHFDAKITADYGDIQHQFSLHCQADTAGGITFSVLEPESIAGTAGTISQSKGKLTFDDQAVAFELLADGQLSPVSGPWILVKALRSGYLSSCCDEESLFHLSIDESYEAQSMGIEVWFDEKGTITNAEIYWQGRMLLSMRIENFEYV